MGVAYLGRDDGLERDVLLKILCGPSARNEAAHASFVREGDLLSGLQHPNILVEVIELAESEGAPFIAFEWLEGTWLADAIEAGIRLKVGLPIIVQVLDGLRYLHDHGIVHRDINPANILIRQDGPAKIMNFGAACLITEQGSGAYPPAADYMSPELIK